MSLSKETQVFDVGDEVEVRRGDRRQSYGEVIDIIRAWVHTNFPSYRTREDWKYVVRFSDEAEKEYLASSLRKFSNVTEEDVLNAQAALLTTLQDLS